MSNIFGGGGDTYGDAAAEEMSPPERQRRSESAFARTLAKRTDAPDDTTRAVIETASRARSVALIIAGLDSGRIPSDARVHRDLARLAQRLNLWAAVAAERHEAA